MKIRRAISSISAILVITGCAQNEAVVVEPVQPEPIYDKWGNEGGGGCTGSATAGASSNCIPYSGGDDYPRVPGTPDGGSGAGDGAAGAGGTGAT